MPVEWDALQRQTSALLESGRTAEALALLRQLVQQQPDLPDLWYNLGYAARRLGQPQLALAAYDRALECGISHPEEVHLNRAVILSDDLRRDADALRELQLALALNPDYPQALLNLGNLHEEYGRREAAVACYQRLLQSRAITAELANLQGEALARLIHLHPPQSPDDPRLHALDRAAAHLQDATVRANLLFALGRALDHLGACTRAFSAFTQANRIVRQHGPGYDRATCERLVDALIESFPRPAELATEAPLNLPEPLFICGLHRSGSTLLERVLATHPQVYAGGELPLLPVPVPGRDVNPPDWLSALDQPARTRALAAGYQRRALELCPAAVGRRYLTDKRPDNLLIVGAIKRLFPRARILITVRDLRDNGLSLYMQHLHPALAPYASDLGDIGHFSRQARRLAKHWTSLYPEDVIEFDYDAFVHEPQPHLHRLLEALGLPWEPACLQFHQHATPVKTASYWQVRQPLNQHASGRWMRYRAHLGPLLEALDAPAT